MSAPSTSSRKTPGKPSARKTRAKAASPNKTPAKAKSKSKAAKTLAITEPVEVKAVSAATPTTADVTPAANLVITDEQIGERAYQIWIEKGRPYGQEDANWQQAVAELRGE